MPPLINTIPHTITPDKSPVTVQLQNSTKSLPPDNLKNDTFTVNKPSKSFGLSNTRKRLGITAGSIVAGVGILLGIRKYVNKKAMYKEARKIVEDFCEYYSKQKEGLNSLKDLFKDAFSLRLDSINITKSITLKSVENNLNDSLSPRPLLFDLYKKTCRSISKESMEKEFKGLELEKLKDKMKALIENCKENEQGEYTRIFSRKEIADTINKSKKLKEQLESHKQDFNKTAGEIEDFLENLYSETVTSAKNICDETVEYAQELLQRLKKRQ